VVELGLLADPEDAEGDEADQVHPQARQGSERAPEVVFAVHGFQGGRSASRGRAGSWRLRILHR
jgi:hypothetical protein